MRKKIIISIHFNSLNYSEKRLTKEWIEERLDIFWKYTLQSFKVQTNQEFEAYLHYDKLSEETVREALARREELPSNIHFGETHENEEAIREAIAVGCDVFYWVRLDSDNLYHKDYIQKLQDYVPLEETEVLVSQNGYLYGEVSGRLVPYYQVSPPFYTLIYKPKEYIRGKRHSTPGGHGSVVKVLKYEVIEGDNFLVSIHSKNVSNGEWLINHRVPLGNVEKSKKLEEFGLSNEGVYDEA